MAKRKPTPAEPRRSHLAAMDEAGFEALTWQHVAVEVTRLDGSIGSEWLPEHMVNWEKRRFVRFNRDNTYSFAGWEPMDGHTFGGRYDTPQGALSWFRWLDAQRAA